MKLVTNKQQTLPGKVPTTFIVRSVDYLIILVLHVTFLSHNCLFKIHVTVVHISWDVFQTKFKPTLIECYISYKIDECAIEH